MKNALVEYLDYQKPVTQLGEAASEVIVAVLHYLLIIGPRVLFALIVFVFATIKTSESVF